MKKELHNYLKSYRLMSLSTYGKNPWVCWVFYVVDKDFNLYFVSSPDSQHVKDIQKNNKVACAITDTMQNPTGDKMGVQLWGEVTEVTPKEKLQTFFKMWKNTINKNENKITYKNYIDKAISSKVYKVTPKKIKWFNQNLDDVEYIMDL